MMQFTTVNLDDFNHFEKVHASFPDEASMVFTAFEALRSSLKRFKEDTTTPEIMEPATLPQEAPQEPVCT